MPTPLSREYPPNDIYFTKLEENSSYAVAHPCVDKALKGGFVEFYDVPTDAEMNELQTVYNKNVTISEVRDCVDLASQLV